MKKVTLSQDLWGTCTLEAELGRVVVDVRYLLVYEDVGTERVHPTTHVESLDLGRTTGELTEVDPDDNHLPTGFVPEWVGSTCLPWSRGLEEPLSILLTSDLGK